MILDPVINYILGEQKFNEFVLYLDKEHKTADDYILFSIIFYLIVVVFVSILFLVKNFSIYIYAIILILSFPLAFVFAYIYFLYNEEQRQLRIETELSDFLLQASLFPRNSDITSILSTLAKQNKGLLSKEFEICLDQIRKGYSVELSLNGIINRNKNKLLQRAMYLLLIGYNSGKDLSDVFNKMSKEIIALQDVSREKTSAISIQKYTLFISSGVLVPLVLKWVSNIVASIDISNLDSLELFAVDKTVAVFAGYAINIYLFEFALISSIFIAIADGNWKKFVLYAIFLIPLAYLVFII